jgi:hypothetical protein
VEPTTASSNDDDITTTSSEADDDDITTTASEVDEEEESPKTQWTEIVRRCYIPSRKYSEEEVGANRRRRMEK